MKTWPGLFGLCLLTCCGVSETPATAAPLPSQSLLVTAAPIESTAAPLAYSIASDLDTRQREAVQELGGRVDVRTVLDRFVIVGSRGQTRSAARTAEIALAAYYNGRFTQRPEQAISVYLFPSAGPYEAYCRSHFQSDCLSSFGFYLPDERRIVMNVGPGIGTLTHELVHPVMQADFPQVPVWLEEGIASLYEAFALGKPGEIHGVVNFRLPVLRAAMNDRHRQPLIRLDGLFGMSDEVFRGDNESLFYALSRYLCLWLDRQELLWPFYHHFRDNYAHDKTGRSSFVAVLGKPPEDAQVPFSRWVRAL